MTDLARGRELQQAWLNACDGLQGESAIGWAWSEWRDWCTDNAPALLSAAEREAVMREAMTKLVREVDDLISNSDGEGWPGDHGCPECTAGTVPDRYNTGLCGLHAGRRALAGEVA